MAPKRKKSSRSSYAVREANRKIWKSASLEQWLSFLRSNDPDGKDWRLKGTQIWTNCRSGVHEDRTPSFIISPDKGFTKCFGCDYYEHDPVKLVNLLTRKTSAETIKLIQTEFGVKILSPAETKVLEDEYAHVQMKNSLGAVLKECLHQAQLCKNELGLEGMAKGEWYFAEDILRWLETRKVLENAYQLPLGILPNEPVFKKIAKELKIDDDLVPEMLRYLKAVMEPLYMGALVFIYHSSPKDISRFRIRRPKADGSKSIIAIDDQYEDKLGIFGLGMYNMLMNQQEGIGNTTKCLMVEGEFDQLQYANRQIEKGNFDWVCLAHGGGANHDVGEIKNYGIKLVYYMPDDDDGGCENAKDIMATNHTLEFRVFNWPDQIKINGPTGTDPDQALAHYGFDVVNKEINDLEHNWVKPEFWCKEQLKRVIRNKGIEEDPVAISKQIFDYARCIGNGQDENQALIVNKWSNAALIEFGVAPDDAAKLTQEFLSKESPETVFLSHIKEKLLSTFEFLTVNSGHSAIPIKAWHKKRRLLVDFRLGNDAHVKAALSATLGALIEWAKAELYIPDFIRYHTNMKGDPEERGLVNQEDSLLKILQLALKSIVATLSDSTMLDVYSSGNHWLYANKDSGDNKKAMVIVNGRNIYKCSFDENDDIKWEELESPKMGKYLFDTNKSIWSSELRNLDDLKNFPPVDLKALIEDVAEVLSEGWTFLDQKTESIALASFCVASAILKIFPQNLQWLVSNERGCGKTALVADFIGGSKGGGINVVEHSHFVDNTTPAGLRQSMDGSSLILIMDEFDNQKAGKYRGEKNEEVMSILRCSSSGTGVYQQGTQHGEAKTFKLSFSSIVAGIDPDVSEANMTRFLTADLKSGLDGHLPPKVLILRRWPADEITKIKRAITLGIYRFIPQILRSHSFITGYFAEHSNKGSFSVIQRQLDSMIILMSVMHAAGMDWKGWFDRVKEVKGQSLAKMSKMTSNEAVMSLILYSGSIEVELGGTRMRRSVSSFFSSANDASILKALNSSGCGVSLHRDMMSGNEKWYLLVVWQTAIYNLLRSSRSSKIKEDPNSLKNIVDRHPTNVPDDKAKNILGTMLDVDYATLQSCYSLFDVTTNVIGDQKLRTNRLIDHQTKAPTPKNDLQEPTIQ